MMRCCTELRMPRLLCRDWIVGGKCGSREMSEEAVSLIQGRENCSICHCVSSGTAEKLIDLMCNF